MFVAPVGPRKKVSKSTKIKVDSFIEELTKMGVTVIEPTEKDMEEIDNFLRGGRKPRGARF